MPPKKTTKRGNLRANTKQKPPPSTSPKALRDVKTVNGEGVSSTNTATNSTDTSSGSSPRRTSPRRPVSNGVTPSVRRSPRKSPVKNSSTEPSPLPRKRKCQSNSEDTMGSCISSKSEKIDGDQKPKSKKRKHGQPKITGYLKKDSSSRARDAAELVSDEAEKPGENKEEHHPEEEERLTEPQPASDNKQATCASSGGVESVEIDKGDVRKDPELGRSSDLQTNSTTVTSVDVKVGVKDRATSEAQKKDEAEDVTATDRQESVEPAASEVTDKPCTPPIEQEAVGSERSEETTCVLSEGPPQQAVGPHTVGDEEAEASEPKHREGTEQKSAGEQNEKHDDGASEIVASKGETDTENGGDGESSSGKGMPAKDQSYDETAKEKTGVPGDGISPPPSSDEPLSDSQQTDKYDSDIEGEKSPKSSHSVSSDVDLESDSNDARLHREEIHETVNKKRSPKLQLRTKWSDADTEEYRNGYPGKKDDRSLDKNLLFYTNKISSRPDGGRIAEIHDNWWGDYRRLETHHGYIQWIFPIRERGMNFQSQELQLFEAKGIRADAEAKKRVLTSYKMMLDFYGMRLASDTTGKLERAKNWSERYTHLNRSFHNYLRITRILKSLGELGYEHLKAPFVEFVLKEAFEHCLLSNCRKSCADYWVHTIRDENDRIRLAEKAEKYNKEKKVASSWFGD